jgi:hypothetical protein
MLKTNFNPNDYVCASQVSATVVGNITVSTVRLPKMKGDADRWETCLFDDINQSRSDVVAMYITRFDAQVGHERIVAALNFMNDAGK